MKTRYVKIALLLAGMSTLTACLKAKETDRVLYDAQKDEFRLVMILENIDGGYSDLDYLGNLLQNKDHLIAPVMPGNVFGYAPWFLRLEDHKTAKVSFVEPRKGDMQPIEAKASLSTMEIRPGTLFVQNNRLGYYHAMIVPGKVVDALIQQTRADQMLPLKKTVATEMERRKKGGKVYTWAELKDQEVKALKSGSTDHPIKPFMVLEEASLNKIVESAGQVNRGIKRQGPEFQIAIPMTPQDIAGMGELWVTWQQAADVEAEKKKDDLMFALQRMPSKSIELRTTDTGVVLSLDITKLYNSFAVAWGKFSESKLPTVTLSEPSFEVKYALQRNWPVEANLNTSQILKDFEAGTLKAYASEKPVAPGKGLKVQPKK